MIQGLLRKDNRPAVPLSIGWSLGIQKIVAIVDTGFSGEVKLPPDIAVELGLTPTHVQAVLLANEQIAEVSASLAFVVIEGEKEEVGVLVAKGMPIMGVGLLSRLGFKLTVDFKARTVSLEK